MRKIDFDKLEKELQAKDMLNQFIGMEELNKSTFTIIAKIAKSYYDALVTEGFNDQNAITLTNSYIKILLQRGFS